MEINTERFSMRTLVPGDATERYLDWLKDATTRHFIVNARQQQLSELFHISNPNQIVKIFYC